MARAGGCRRWWSGSGAWPRTTRWTRPGRSPAEAGRPAGTSATCARSSRSADPLPGPWQGGDRPGVQQVIDHSPMALPVQNDELSKIPIFGHENAVLLNGEGEDVTVRQSWRKIGAHTHHIVGEGAKKGSESGMVAFIKQLPHRGTAG